MNYRYAGYLLSEIIIVIGGILLIPLILAFAFGEETTPHAFGVTASCCIGIGALGLLLRPKKDQRRLSQFAGLIICGIAWIIISLISAIPYCVSGVIPSYLDAVFESVSGYTTTGATIVTNVEALPKSILFFRSLTQWIGGMGVVVFMIAILSKDDKASLALVKAETPGPQFGKLVSKLRFTTQILYAIYIVMTLILVGILVACKMPVFDSFCHAFATASTGGFSTKATSIAAYDSVAIESVLTVFMILFSVNFNVYYMILIGHGLKALKSEELWWMIGLFIGLSVFIAFFLWPDQNYPPYDDFWTSLRYSSFQVASILSTTGFSTADFTTWPITPQLMLCLIMFIGGSSGSTAGGLKISRFVILAKSSRSNIRKNLSQRSIIVVRFDGKALSESYVDGIHHFFSLYLFVLLLSMFLVSLTIPSATELGFETAITSVITCINNVGPGLGNIGPLYTFEEFHPFAKIVLCFDMLIGRLEIYPIVLLFTTKAWKRI